MTRSDLQSLSTLRLREAQLLLASDCPSGAYYLAGYATECALKACIANATQQYDFPDLSRVRNSWVHDLEKLVHVAGLSQELRKRREQDRAFDINWEIAIAWSGDSRYATWRFSEAESLMNAIADEEHGVLQWITTQW